ARIGEMRVEQARPAVQEGPAANNGSAASRLTGGAVWFGAAAPLIAACIVAARLWGSSWTPMGDWAAMWLRADCVPTIHTPLVGAYSVRGFAHPGPSIFWLVWSLKQLSLRSVPRSFALMAIINGATLSATVLVAKRWLGLTTALVTAVVAIAIIHNLG